VGALDSIGTRVTPQTEPVHGVTTATNAAGGHGFQIDDWDRLRRFLILGTDGGTYYAGERSHTLANVDCLRRCIASDGRRVVDMAVEVSDAGRAPDNDPAIFALAAAAAADDLEVRRYALDSLPKVCRIGTHLFHFAQFVENHRGWGRSLTRAVGRWYTDRNADDLAHQIVKYRQRDGWSHRDLLRLSHPTAPSDAHRTIFDVACGRDPEGEMPAIIDSYRKAQDASDPAETAELIREHRLTREMVRADHLASADVWAALLEVGMPMTALVRNLGVLSSRDILTPMSQAERSVTDRLSNVDDLKRSRIHPIAILKALAVYASGGGHLGSNTWKPVPSVVDALDAAFYATFGNVLPADKRTLIALDVSGSMTWSERPIAPLSAAQVAAAMSLITAATEPQYAVMAFADQFRPINVSPRQRLDDVQRMTKGMTFGRTDCALPMVWAIQNRAEVDTFMVLTDNETWAGSIHPFQALREYRNVSGIDARLVVAGMTATDFSIADPNDAGMLDVVGFDTAMPQLVADFSAGRI
jgi:60 kDa SS-A/Ro ribonucleoprotein